MNLKSILESILFVNENPVTVEEIVRALDIEKEKIIESLELLRKEYAERESGISIVKVAGGYQMCSSASNAEWIRKIYKERFKQHLSRASLEVLAIIAYKQPVTKLEIESIRGVNCTEVLKTLLNMGLIKIAGRKNVLGRPFLYRTSRKFLEYFGLNSLSELPRLDEISSFLSKRESAFQGSDIKEEVSDEIT